MDHLKAIDGLIVFHRTEIERLETARKVILELNRRFEDRVSEKRAAKTAKPAKPKANGKPPPESLLTAPVIRERVKEMLAAGALESGTIMQRLGTESKQAKQRVYGVLFALKKEGDISQSEDRAYSLAVAA